MNYENDDNLSIAGTALFIIIIYIKKADKAGVVHVSFGKSNFTHTQLLENLTALYKSIEKNRPSGVKGKYFKTLFICTSMGPSIKLDVNAFDE